MDKNILSIEDVTPAFVRRLCYHLRHCVSREILNLDIPAAESTVNVVCMSRETIISFNGLLTNSFTLNVTASPSTLKGDRIYIMLQRNNPGGEPPPIIVTFTGQISNILCGGLNEEGNSWECNTYMNALEMIYTGNEFTGIDNC